MTWEGIMEIKSPTEALKQIAKKVVVEELSLVVLEERVREYQLIHGIDSDEMSFYPNGERVITLELFWEFEKEREKRMEEKYKKDNDD